MTELTIQIVGQPEPLTGSVEFHCRCGFALSTADHKNFAAYEKARKDHRDACPMRFDKPWPFDRLPSLRRRGGASGPSAPACQCPPCPGRGYDGHGMQHCAECCMGTMVDAAIDCPTHGDPRYNRPPQTPSGTGPAMVGESVSEGSDADLTGATPPRSGRQAAALERAAATHSRRLLARLFPSAPAWVLPRWEVGL